MSTPVSSTKAGPNAILHSQKEKKDAGKWKPAYTSDGYALDLPGYGGDSVAGSVSGSPVIGMFTNDSGVFINTDNSDNKQDVTASQGPSSDEQSHPSSDGSSYRPDQATSSVERPSHTRLGAVKLPSLRVAVAGVPMPTAHSTSHIHPHSATFPPRDRSLLHSIDAVKTQSPPLAHNSHFYPHSAGPYTTSFSHTSGLPNVGLGIPAVDPLRLPAMPQPAHQPSSARPFLDVQPRRGSTHSYGSSPSDDNDNSAHLWQCLTSDPIEPPHAQRATAHKIVYPSPVRSLSSGSEARKIRMEDVLASSRKIYVSKPAHVRADEAEAKAARIFPSLPEAVHRRYGASGSDGVTEERTKKKRTHSTANRSITGMPGLHRVVSMSNIGEYSHDATFASDNSASAHLAPRPTINRTRSCLGAVAGMSKSANTLYNDKQSGALKAVSRYDSASGETSDDSGSDSLLSDDASCSDNDASADDTTPDMTFHSTTTASAPSPTNTAELHDAILEKLANSDSTKTAAPYAMPSGGRKILGEISTYSARVSGNHVGCSSPSVPLKHAVQPAEAKSGDKENRAQPRAVAAGVPGKDGKISQVERDCAAVLLGMGGFD